MHAIGSWYSLTVSSGNHYRPKAGNNLKSSYHLLPPSQVDIGQGLKPPGYYVQRSRGLFPAPWPQDSTELPRVSRLFQVLGMFMAKCLQDGRRVDLPLARPFFKLLCTPVREASGGETGGEEPGGEDSTQGPLSNRNEESEPNQPVSNQSPRPSTPDSPTPDHSENGAELIPVGGAGSKDGLLLAGVGEEISKDGGGKEEVVLEELPAGEPPSEAPWFAGILGLEDLMEVSPFRGKFLAQVRHSACRSPALCCPVSAGGGWGSGRFITRSGCSIPSQLQSLVQRRDSILEDPSLSPSELARQLAALTLPGHEENLPGVHLKDLA